MTAGLREHLEHALAGAYTLERELAGGGMSHVFVADDTTLRRKVVVKVLRDDLAEGLSAERFKREIQLVARLQHPHILPLLSAGALQDAGGSLYYTMPFVQGESLRARLEREGALPISDVVHLLRDVASALSYAHRQRIVHRDIKPENILLADGGAVVSDFGIAKALHAARADETTADGQHSTTLTQRGMSLGTPAYMAPEQAVGEVVDHRADLYSLGVVVYEMLAGRAPFEARTAQRLIAAHAAEAPEPIDRRRRSVPAPLGELVMRLLEKEPADRPQTADELLRTLDAVAALTAESHGRAAAGDVPPPPSKAILASRIRMRDPALLMFAAVAAIATASAIWLGLRHGSSDDPVVRFELPGAGLLAFARSDISPIRGGGGTWMALTADGHTLVYTGAVGISRQLFVRSLDDLNARPLAGTIQARNPAFSPDGKWLAFTQEGQLKKMPSEGGPIVPLAQLSGASQSSQTAEISGVSWASDEVIIVGYARRMAAVPANGGTPRFVTTLDTAAREGSQSVPCAAADGTLLFYRSVPPSRIVVLQLKSGKHAVLDITGVQVLGLLDDQLIFANGGGALMAVRFDARNLKTVGAPVPLEEGLGVVPGAGVRAALSQSGTLAYQKGSRDAQVVLVDGQGHERMVIAEPRLYNTPRLSPDGRKLAMSIGAWPALDIWTYDLASATLARLTTQGDNDRVEWSPDGKRVLFRTTRNDRDQLWWQLADGSAPAEPLLTPKYGAQEGVISRDMKWLVFRNNGSATRRDIYYRALRGDTTTHPVAVSQFDELEPRLSHDDQWIAYASDESGQLEVYVRPFPTLDRKLKVSVDGGSEPVWSPDSRTLYYRHGNELIGTSLAVERSGGGGLRVARRETVLRGDYLAIGIHANYDVTPDGKSFLMLKHVGPEAQLIVVHNWAKEVRQRTQAR